MPDDLSQTDPALAAQILGQTAAPPPPVDAAIASAPPSVQLPYGIDIPLSAPPPVATAGAPPALSPLDYAASLPKPPPLGDLQLPYGITIPTAQPSTAPVAPAPPAAAPDQLAAPPPVQLPYGLSVPLGAPPPVGSPAPPAGPGAPPFAGLAPPKLATEAAGLARNEAAYQAVARTYDMRPDKLLADMVGGKPQTPQQEGDVQRYLTELRVRNPVQFADVEAHLEMARQDALNAAKQRAVTENTRRELDNQQMLVNAINESKAAAARIDARAQELANSKYDPTSGMTSPQQIAGVLGAVVGGLVQARTGSAHNAGMDALNAIFERNLQVQKLNTEKQMTLLGQQRSNAATQLALSKDLYEAQEAARLASLKTADDQLATMQQNFAPGGTRAIAIAKTRAAVQGQMAQARMDIEQKGLDNSIKLQNANRETALAQETMRHNQATEGVEWAKLSLERAKHKADNEVLTPAQIRAEYPTAPADSIPSKAMTRKDVKQHFETYNAATEAGAKNLEQDIKGQASQINVPAWQGPDGTAQSLVGADGKPLRLPPEEAFKAQKALNYGQKMVDVLSKINRTLAQDPSMVDRPTWSVLASEYEKAKMEMAKSLDANVSSREMQALENAFGPTFEKLRDRAINVGVAQAHIRSLIDGVQSDVLTDAQGHKAAIPVDATTGAPRPLLRDTSQLPPHEPTAVERALADLKTNPHITPDEAARQELQYQADALHVPRSPDGSGTIMWSLVPKDLALQAQRAASAAAAVSTEITPTQSHGIEALHTAALAGDANSLAQLRSIATGKGKESAPPAVQRLAKAAVGDVELHARDQAMVDATPAPAPTVDYKLPDFNTPAQPSFPGGQ